MNNKKGLLLILFFLSLIGVADSSYLVYEHFTNYSPPCAINNFFDCGKVTNSSYAIFFGIPLSIIGLVHYFLLATLIMLVYLNRSFNNNIIFIQIIVGFFFSLYLLFLQIFILQAICFYCLISAIICIILFTLISLFFRPELIRLKLELISFCYHYFLKPIFFLIDAEFIHQIMTGTGYRLGKHSIYKKTIKYIFYYHNIKLQQNINGIKFKSPIGLAAGFDYKSDLPEILPSLGFGFTTVGTITNSPYQGNPKPRLGRLPKSKSLLVNKGFKNNGALKTVVKMQHQKFTIPVGVSIGRTNNPNLNFQKSILDIVQTFNIFEQANMPISYYELNISCPNLFGNVNFYKVDKLQQLLNAVDNLKISKPIYIKMPIDKTDRQTLAMLKVISKHNINGVIFGNLQKDRKNPLLDKVEVAKFPVGNFSGKPTFDRSNELIKLTYKHYKNKLIIIGCGGVFSADDAYLKIKLGATLVQLITGLIYNGPQLVSQINQQLVTKLEQDNLKNITEAIGKDNN